MTPLIPTSADSVASSPLLSVPEPDAAIVRPTRLAWPIAPWVVRDVLIPFVATRGALLLVALLALALLPRDPAPDKLEYSSHAWVNAFARWDAMWQLSIVLNGYQYEPGQQSNVVFFPLFPLLMKAVGLVLGRDDPEGYLIAGIIVANVSLLIAVAYLVRLVRLDFDAATAGRTALYLLVFPTSFFLSAVYPESLFLTLAVAAFYHGRRGQWWLAGVLAALAALSRPHGVLLALPLAVEYLAQRRFDPRALRLDVLALGFGPAAFGGYLWHLHQQFGDPLIFVRAQEVWGRQLRPPWEVLLAYVHEPLVVHAMPPDLSLIDLGFALFLVGLAACTWRLVRPSYALFASLSLAAMIGAGQLTSVMRYGITLFPLFIVLAVAGRRGTWDRAYVVVSSSLGALLMATYALWRWVA